MSLDEHLEQRRQTRRELHEKLEILLDIRDVTDPLVPASEQGKDKLAGAALVLAGDLFMSMVGWALRHQLGKAKEGIWNFDRPECPYCGRDVEDLEPSSAQDSHHFESDGFFDKHEPATKRQLLVSLLHWIRYARDIDAAASDLGRALHLLNIGSSDHELLQKSCAHKSSRARVAAHMLTAIELVWYLRGQGFKRHSADKIVADGFGVSPATIQSWEKRELPSMYGTVQLARRKGRALRAGELKLKRSVSRSDSEPRDIMAEALRDVFDQAGITELGRGYQVALRKLKQK